MKNNICLYLTCLIIFSGTIFAMQQDISKAEGRSPITILAKEITPPTDIRQTILDTVDNVINDCESITNIKTELKKNGFTEIEKSQGNEKKNRNKSLLKYRKSPVSASKKILCLVILFATFCMVVGLTGVTNNGSLFCSPEQLLIVTCFCCKFVPSDCGWISKLFNFCDNNQSFITTCNSKWNACGKNSTQASSLCAAKTYGHFLKEGSLAIKESIYPFECSELLPHKQGPSFAVFCISLSLAFVFYLNFSSKTAPIQKSTEPPVVQFLLQVLLQNIWQYINNEWESTKEQWDSFVEDIFE